MHSAPLAPGLTRNTFQIGTHCEVRAMVHAQHALLIILYFLGYSLQWPI